MKRALACVAGLAMSVTSALALPPIMDRVAPGPALVFVVPSLENFEKELDGVGKLFGSTDALKLETLLEDSPFAAASAAISKKGAMAFVIPEAPKDENEEPKWVALVSVEDYSAFAKGLGGKGDGSAEKISVEGEDMFVKKVDGGFAAFSADQALLNATTFNPGNTKAHQTFFGAKAEKAADDAEMAIFFDVQKFRPAMEQGLKGMEEQMKEMAEMSGQGAAPINPAAMKFFMDNVINDAVGGVATMNASGGSVALDLMASFKPESRMGKITSVVGKAPALLKNLPAGPYLAVLAADLSNADLRKFMQEIPKTEGGPGAAITKATNDSIFNRSTGLASVIGVNPGGIMAGLLTRSVTFYQTTDVAGLKKDLAEEMPKAMEKDKMGSYTYKPEAADVEGKKVDVYEMTIEMGDDVPMAGQMMQLMYGMAGQPSGYVFAVPGGMAMTMSKASDLANATMNAPTAEANLGADKLIASVGKGMPEGRVAEVFIGTKGLLDSLLPMAAMFTGTPIKVDIPANVSPLGLAITPGQSTLTASIFLPADALKTLGSVGAAFEKQMGGEEEEAPAPEEKKEPAGSAPKF